MGVDAIEQEEQRYLTEVLQNIKSDNQRLAILRKINYEATHVNFHRNPETETVKMDTFRKSVTDASRQSVQNTSGEKFRRVACAVIHLSESTEALLDQVKLGSVKSALGYRPNQQELRQHIDRILQKARADSHTQSGDAHDNGAGASGNRLPAFRRSAGPSPSPNDVMYHSDSKDDVDNVTPASGDPAPEKETKRKSSQVGEDETGTTGGHHKRSKTRTDTSHIICHKGKERAVDQIATLTFAHSGANSHEGIPTSYVSNPNAGISAAAESHKRPILADEKPNPLANVPCLFKSTEKDLSSEAPVLREQRQQEGTDTSLDSSDPALVSSTSIAPVGDAGESLFLPDVPEKKKSGAFAATDTTRPIPSDNNGRKVNQSASKTPTSSLKGSGKAGSASTTPTSAPSSGKIERMSATKRKLQQKSMDKHKRA